MDLIKATILLVEDDPAILKLLEYIFKKEYSVVLAINGKDALEKISEHKPDLIISDIMMPRMDGYETLTKLKNDPETMNIPFIFLTSVQSPASKRLSRELGASNYILKPFKAKEFLEVINMQIIPNLK